MTTGYNGYIGGTMHVDGMPQTDATARPQNGGETAQTAQTGYNGYLCGVMHVNGMPQTTTK